MGAAHLQNGVCVLPEIDHLASGLKMLENDIAEANGEAVILETVALDPAREAKVLTRVRAERDDADG